MLKKGEGRKNTNLALRLGACRLPLRFLHTYTSKISIKGLPINEKKADIPLLIAPGATQRTDTPKPNTTRRVNNEITTRGRGWDYEYLGVPYAIHPKDFVRLLSMHSIHLPRELAQTPRYYCYFSKVSSLYAERWDTCYLPILTTFINVSFFS